MTDSGATATFTGMEWAVIVQALDTYLISETKDYLMRGIDPAKSQWLAHIKWVQEISNQKMREADGE